jgi:signal transduction histidine kinase
MTLDGLAALWRRHRLLTDSALAVLLAVLAMLSLINQYRLNEQVGTPVSRSEAVSVLLVLCCVAPLAFRRIVPEWSFMIAVAAFIVTRIVEAPEPTVTVVALIAAYVSFGINGSERWRNPLRVAATIAYIGMYVFLAVRVARRADLGHAFNTIVAFDAMFSGLLILAAWVMGDTWRQRAEHGRDLAARTIELDEERRLNAERAVVDERVRIARELHDVLAHHVSVMGVQAAAANRLVERDPTRARQSLSVIEGSSREAVDEFRRLVGFLRSGADADSSDPQPGLSRCEELVADARRSGLDVRVTTTGECVPLPPGLDLSAFRVVQEALTNTRKHAAATRADVVIDYQPTRLQITVTDDGRGSAGLPGTGLGLIGMRERLRLHEGTLEAGPTLTGGFRVHAVFPLRGTA